MMTNPYERYKQQSVMTMTQGEMLTKLYDEIIKQLTGATIYMEKKDISGANAALQKAQKVLNHLKMTLNYDYPISNNLASLYDYFIRRIVAANIRKESAPIQEVLPMIEELRETFVQADRQARAQ